MKTYRINRVLIAGSPRFQVAEVVVRPDSIIEHRTIEVFKDEDVAHECVSRLKEQQHQNEKETK